VEDFRIVYNVVADEPLPAVLGKVPATDADPTAVLKYNFSYGNSAGLLALGDDGEIRLSPHIDSSLNVNIRAQFGVVVSDGRNEARARLSLQLNHVTHAMLASSVSLRLANVTGDTFLHPFLNFLEEALTVVLPCSADDITVFGVRSDEEAVNVTFAVSQGESNSEEYVDPSYVKQRVYLHRDTLERISSLRLLPFSDDICVKEPCLNYERCVTVPRFGAERVLLRQRSVVFASVGTLLTYSCSCPDGFTGLTTRYTCDTKVDLCYSGPCLNNGTCVSTEESTRCLCPPGFTGAACEHLIGEEESCGRGGSCGPARPCPCEECPESSPECDLGTRSFGPGSFLALRELRQRVGVNVTLEFATRRDRGLIFFNGRLDDRSDFVALELRRKTLLFHFSTGTSYQVAELTREGGFSDGSFHRVEVDYRQAAVVLSVGDCDKRLALLPDSVGLAGSLRCANTSDTHGDMTSGGANNCGSFLNHCSKYLDLTAPLMLGGLPPTTAGRREIEAREFEGCVRALQVDGHPAKWGDVVLNNGSIHGCPEKRGFCEAAGDAKCTNGGRCADGWRSHLCHCAPGWTGEACERRAGTAYDMNREILFEKEQIVPVRFPWRQSLSFRTTSEDGSLLRVRLEDDQTAELVVDRASLVYRVSGGLRLALGSSFVADGVWHRVEVKWMQNETWVSLDYGQLEETVAHTNYRVGALVTGIAAGGNLRGCIRVSNQHDTHTLNSVN